MNSSTYSSGSIAAAAGLVLFILIWCFVLIILVTFQPYWVFNTNCGKKNKKLPKTIDYVRVFVISLIIALIIVLLVWLLRA